jgi:two-component system cell cycle sensor histidine kinase/response regulator CckA
VEGITRDISNQKNIEESLRNTEERFRLAFHTSPDSINLNRVADGSFIEVNQGFTDLTGYTRDDVTGKTSYDINIWNDPADRDRLISGLRKTGIVKNLEAQFKRKNGEIGVGLMSARILNINGEDVILSVTRDITARKAVEEALLQSDGQLRLITDNMVDVISQTDAQMNIIYTSPSVERVFGYRPEELVGTTATHLVHPDDMESVLQQARKAREQSAPSVLLKYRWRHTNGSYLWTESTARLLYDEEGQSMGAIFGTRDIDDRMQAEMERAKLESQLAQAQKLEAVGGLAGGVAHDLNNLLSPILGYGELLLKDTTENDPRKDKLERILKAAKGARNLVRQLLAFSRKQTLEYKVMNVNETLAGFEKLLRKLIRENIEIKILPSPHIKSIMADIGQIEQVIMNLVINAADAMPEGGKLTIETANVALDEDYTKTRPGVKPGEYVMLAFSDTGYGMDEETRLRIFDPFFSTKGDHGTGLGLATVYGIVKQHGGNIWVYSEPGQGTTFKIYMPISEKVSPREKAIRRDEKDHDGTETILVVEDNELVRDIVCNILDDHGYRVLESENGREARKAVAAESVDLLLTDVVMPDMNGKELHAQLERDLPGLKVVYMSGYTDNVIAHHGVLDEGVDFIQKPISTITLLSKLRSVLDRDEKTDRMKI